MANFSFRYFRADLDGDASLSLQELARFINRRIREHIEASIRNNPIQFSEIDQSPRNGLVTWDEYYTYFLKTLGYDDAFIRQVDRSRSTNLDRKTKELLMREKALWNEAARTDSYSLTLDEFLSFRHPGKGKNEYFFQIVAWMQLFIAHLLFLNKRSSSNLHFFPVI